MVFTSVQMEEMKQEFITLLKSTNRAGIDDLINWLETKSDFFTAPASCYYHGSHPGGLLAHSLNVYKAAKQIQMMASNLALPEKNVMSIPEESIILCTLLHDLCKTNMYSETVKFYKDDQAAYGQQWKKYQSYEIKDNFPLGHGEKSVIMLQNFIRLSGVEICAIRWHMGMTDPGAYLSPYEKPAMMKAINDIPLVHIIMQADSFASFMMEKEVDQKIANALD